jgi:hypothetical protein
LISTKVVETPSSGASFRGARRTSTCLIRGSSGQRCYALIIRPERRDEVGAITRLTLDATGNINGCHKPPRTRPITKTFSTLAR